MKKRRIYVRKKKYGSEEFVERFREIYQKLYGIPDRNKTKKWMKKLTIPVGYEKNGRCRKSNT